MKETYIVCYDITGPRRLTKVFKIMRGFGDHLQYSVFVCDLSPREVAKLKDKLNAVIDHRDDQVVFIPIGPPDGQVARRIFALGVGYSRQHTHCVVV